MRRRSLHNLSFYSIRLHLIASLILPVGLVFMLAWAFASSLISKQADQVFDRLLLGMAKSIEQRLILRDGELNLNMPYFSLDVMEVASAEKMFYRVEKQTGELLAGFKGLKFPQRDNTAGAASRALATPGLSGTELTDTKLSDTDNGRRVQFYNTVFAGNPLRAVFLYIPGDSARSSALITVAESLNSRETFTEDLLQVLATIALSVCLVLVLASVLAIQRGVKPLNRLAESIQQRPEHDLSPLQIDGPIPKEVRPLLESLHGLIGRSKDNIEHIQRFNADVSHQLRTPLAEIKTLSQLGQREDSALADRKARFAEIERITDFLSHTTEQLLAYAKTRQSLLDQQQLQRLDLAALVREQAMLQAPRIYRQGGEIDFQAPDQPLWIAGDRVMLAGLLHNLLDNALYYGHQPGCGAEIQLQVALCGDQVLLQVADRGPGIPEDQLDTVTERFVRLDQQGQQHQREGSGLGLAIAGQICAYHSAGLTLSNRAADADARGGLQVSIAFPCYAVSGAPAAD